MGILKNRSDYFKSIANKNRLIAHGRVLEGEERLSFFRLNDEEELLAACINYIHFPCVVHFDFSARYTTNTRSQPKRRLTNALVFIDKAENPNDMDQVELAKDRAFTAGEEFISYLVNDFSIQGGCGEFDNLDTARMSLVPYGIINGQLFCYMLQFEDDRYAPGITTLDPTKWFE